MGQAAGGAGQGSSEFFGELLGALETSVADACRTEDQWPAQVAAGIYAGVDYAIAHPTVVDALHAYPTAERTSPGGYTRTVERLAELISRDAPAGSRLPGSTDEALVAGIVGLVGDHIRVGRFEALRELRPDLVLLATLPYLGFDEARRWANQLV
jgi:hypothetical protein